MTLRSTFTQAQVQRAISAAHKAGLCVIGIRPDGTVIIGNAPLAERTSDGQASNPSKWEDVEA